MFTVKQTDGTEVVYKGFSGHTPGSSHLVVAMFDGGEDLYSLDPGAGIVQPLTELRRMYQDGYSRQPSSVTVYLRQDVSQRRDVTEAVRALETSSVVKPEYNVGVGTMRHVRLVDEELFQQLLVAVAV